MALGSCFCRTSVGTLQQTSRMMSLSATPWKFLLRTVASPLPLQVLSLLQVLAFVVTFVRILLPSTPLEGFNNSHLLIAVVPLLVSIAIPVKTLFLLTLSAKAKTLEVLREPLLLAVVSNRQLTLTPSLVLLFPLLPLLRIGIQTKISRELQSHIRRQSKP